MMAKPKEEKSEQIDKEQLTEVEMLKIEKALLSIDVLRLRLENVEKEKNELIQSIVIAHKFEKDATIQYPQGFIQGKKLKTLKVVDDKGSDDS